MFKEFREFALKGNVMDLAVGVIIGGAFGGIVNSLVNDIIMPPVGKMLGGLDFKDYFIQLGGDAALQTLDAAKKAGVPVIAYGNFLTVLINFLILAFIIFMMVKTMNSMKRAEAAAPPPPPPEPPRSEVLLAEIRDLLKK
ncbi:MAG: large conductance mechanosensitive channel protein MscL [Bryobacterales bacterium]|nr:large conductance mechanosensitive channel protein MscL [Bryobacterales bacterium]